MTPASIVATAAALALAAAGLWALAAASLASGAPAGPVTADAPALAYALSVVGQIALPWVTAGWLLDRLGDGRARLYPWILARVWPAQDEARRARRAHLWGARTRCVVGTVAWKIGCDAGFFALVGDPLRAFDVGGLLAFTLVQFVALRLIGEELVVDAVIPRLATGDRPPPTRRRRRLGLVAARWLHAHDDGVHAGAPLRRVALGPWLVCASAALSWPAYDVGAALWAHGAADPVAIYAGYGYALLLLFTIGGYLARIWGYNVGALAVGLLLERGVDRLLGRFGPSERVRRARRALVTRGVGVVAVAAALPALAAHVGPGDAPVAAPTPPPLRAASDAARVYGGDEIILQGFHWNSARVIDVDPDGVPTYLDDPFAVISPTCGDARWATQRREAHHPTLGDREAAIDVVCAAARAGSWYVALARRARAIAELGVTTVWMPPPWPDASTHRAEAGNAIFGGEGYAWSGFGFERADGTLRRDSNYGTDRELRAAARALRGAGLKLVYDVVANHRHHLDHWKLPPYLYRGPADHDPTVRPDPAGRPTAIDTLRARFHPSTASAYGGDGGDGSALLDLDTGSPAVRRAFIDELTTLVRSYGADGFRWDFVRGYPAAHVADWMRAVEGHVGRPLLSIGELWKTACEYAAPGANREGLDPAWLDRLCRNGARAPLLERWAREAQSQVFDYALKDAFQRIPPDPSGWRAGLNGNPDPAWRMRAVTFVDNHDTGYSPGPAGGQHHWAFPDTVWGADARLRDGAYAYILSAPGTPAIYWPDAFDWGRYAMIQHLVKIRRAAGVRAWSTIVFHGQHEGMVATVEGDNARLVLAIFSPLDDPRRVAPGARFLPAPVADGPWGRIWMEAPAGLPTQELALR